MPVDVMAAGGPAPVLSGSGTPDTNYNASAANANQIYVQLDAVPGQRMWLCSNVSGTYKWEHLSIPLAVVSTASFSSTSILGLGKQTKTVTVPGATTDMGVFCAIIGDPGNLMFYASGFVSSANTVTINLNNLSALALTPTAVAVRFVVQ